MYTKGADTIIIPLLRKDNPNLGYTKKYSIWGQGGFKGRGGIPMRQGKIPLDITYMQ